MNRSKRRIPLRYLLAVVAAGAALYCGLPRTGAQVRPATGPAVQPATAVASPSTIDVRQLGAVGDGVADDTAAIQRALDRVAKAADGYPPYNIERIARANGQPDRLRITLAVAGFTRDQLDVTVEESQLVIRGRQQDDKERHYLHRGIAARQFQRTFVLADGMEVLGADLKNGLLSIDLVRPNPDRIVKTISINECE